MDLYTEYAKEREDREIITEKDVYGNDIGFGSYAYLPDDDCYFVDVYVRKEYRRQGICTKIIDEISVIAREHGSKILYTSVDPKANGTTGSLYMILSNGFELHKMDNTLIYFKKSLED